MRSLGIQTLCIHRCSGFLLLVLTWILVTSPSLQARSHSVKHAVLVPIPDVLRSEDFVVTLNGQPVPVVHAAASYDYVNFAITGSVDIKITARDAGFWNAGVDVQPWRLGIRPTRKGNTIRFHLKRPADLAISLPQDFLNDARMLFIFATPPVAPPPKGKNVHVVPPGLHEGNINPKNGEIWYLDPGAVIQGSINLWHVNHVKILGSGVVLYDGPQNPDSDQGWMQRPDWHCIGALDSHDVEIRGVTCLVRSRTWSIQMKDSTGFVYDGLHVIGGNPGNANQDGMDWLGGGDTIVRNSFFRTSDDVFAMQGNWDGYGEAAMVHPGHEVANILIENSELSTSISNIVRAGWPQKTYSSHHFTLRNSDVLAGGIGACGLPFALFTYWGDKGASGDQSDFTFENLFLDDWYSLVQMKQENPALHHFIFRNIWALGQPPLTASLLAGDVYDVHLSNVKYGQQRVDQDSRVPLSVQDGAAKPIYDSAAGVQASFSVQGTAVIPGQRVRFEATKQKIRHVRYTWIFGDGSKANGRRVRHRFQDALGTELNGDREGSGSFRVLLHVENKRNPNEQDWAEQPVIVVGRWQSAQPDVQVKPGLHYQIYPGTWKNFPDFAQEVPANIGVTSTLKMADTGGFSHYAAVWDGYVIVPTDGGYLFHLMARDGAKLYLDGQVVAQTGTPFAEVCGSPGNAVRYAAGAIGLRAGKHRFKLEALQTMSLGTPQLLWEGPGIPLGAIPAAAFVH